MNRGIDLLSCIQKPTTLLCLLLGLFGLVVQIADPLNATAQSCGEMGGVYCSQTGSCPPRYTSLGTTYDCDPCCGEEPPAGPSCGALGGDYCSPNGSCPSGYTSLGPTYDCNSCCDEAPPTGPSCGALGGDYCSPNGSCPAGYTSLGPTYDCNPCCDEVPSTGPSCGALGGDYCSPSTSCPPGFDPLGSTYDCTTCCQRQLIDDAVVVSKVFPLSMSCGESIVASVTVLNAGTSPWTQDIFRLGAVGDSDPLSPGSVRVLLPPNVTVTPGSTHSFVFPLTAPSKPGSYLTDWQMVHERVRWFGETASQKIRVACGAGSDDANVVSHTIPGIMEASTSYDVTVTMLNTGISTWTRDGEGSPDGSQGYKLAVKSGNLLPIDTRILLPPGVEVGVQMSYPFSFTLLAPELDGVYCSEMQMIHDGFGWFGQALSLCVDVGVWGGPYVTHLSPPAGPPGTGVTVYGNGFSSNASLRFSFGDPEYHPYSRVPVDFARESSSEFTFTVPEGADCGSHYVSLADEIMTDDGPQEVVTDSLEFVVTPPCKPDRRNSFSVVSYNIQMLPDEICAIVYKDLHKCHKDYRAGLIAAHPLLQGHDAIVFVEAFSDSHRELILQRLFSEYPYQGLILGTDTFGLQDGGVIIISKWPIEEEDQTIFNDRTGVDWFADKGVNYAEINKAGQLYHIFGTHLDSAQNDGDRAVRTLQLRQMASFIKGKGIASDEAVLMAGDFNIDRNADHNPLTYEYPRMLATLNASQPPIEGFAFSTNPAGQWLDYVLYSNGHLQPSRSGNRVLKPRDAGGGDLSDHYAVLGTFYFDFLDPTSISLFPFRWGGSKW